MWYIFLPVGPLTMQGFTLSTEATVDVFKSLCSATAVSSNSATSI